jgi:molybdopterin-guanine dinucleotide biosynthesis protein A
VTAGFVLAGGRSTRMGTDKALMTWQGEPLVARALAQLRRLGLRARIAGTRPDLAQYAEVVDDAHPGCGPLAGIEAALAASDAELNLFVPVDLPLVPDAFLRWMVERARATDALATVPFVSGRAEPLCAVYHRSLAPGIAQALERGEYKVMRGVEAAVEMAQHDSQHDGMGLDAFAVEEVYATRFDWPAEVPVMRWFANWNTPSDVC